MYNTSIEIKLRDCRKDNIGGGTGAMTILYWEFDNEKKISYRALIIIFCQMQLNVEQFKQISVYASFCKYKYYIIILDNHKNKK